MKDIGGFFELDLNFNCKHYHSNVIALNSGRNAFKYILIIKKPKKVYVPFYSCESVVEPLKKLGIEYEYYSINERFEPMLPKILGISEYVLYINYFGVNDKQVQILGNSIQNLIIDNTQAFFSKPINGIDTFYSPRKFFGVADGGLAYINSGLKLNLDRDISFDRYQHILKRIDVNAQDSYSFFVSNEENMKNQELKKMSKLTEAILKNIDYQTISRKRMENYKYIHSNLFDINLLQLDLTEINVPMVYPLLIHKEGLREHLIKNRVYVASYWKEVQEIRETNTIEYGFSKNLIPLPIDQRYNSSDMDFIISLIRQYIKE